MLYVHTINMYLLDEEPASLTGKRVIIYVIPDYSVPNLDARTCTVLQKCKILPPDLRLYSKTGCREDQRVIHELFGKGYASITLSGEVQAEDMLSQLEMAITTDNPSVVVFVYCGHGLLSSKGYELILPYNQRISKEDIEGVLCKTRYQGTYVEVINICTDKKGKSSYQDINYIMKRSLYHGATVIGENTPREMCDQYSGSAFMKAVHTFVTERTDQTITYGDLQALKEYHTCYVAYTDADIQHVKIGNGVGVEFTEEQSTTLDLDNE